MLGKILKVAGLQNEDERKNKLYRELLKHEAKIGGELFGPVPHDGRREFFCLDEYTWIWYEEWTDQNKQIQSRTTRYDVRPQQGITKIQDGKKYEELSDKEALRLYDAMKAYRRRVKNELYKAVV